MSKERTKGRVIMESLKELITIDNCKICGEESLGIESIDKEEDLNILLTPHFFGDSKELLGFHVMSFPASELDEFLEWRENKDNQSTN